MRRFSRQLPLAFLASTISHFLIQATFAVTMGGLGQLTDARYVAAVSAIFGAVAFGLFQTKRPLMVGLAFGTALFVFVQILRIPLVDGFSARSFWSDLLFDFGYFLLPTSLMLGYQKWSDSRAKPITQ